MSLKFVCFYFILFKFIGVRYASELIHLEQTPISTWVGFVQLQPLGDDDDVSLRMMLDANVHTIFM